MVKKQRNDSLSYDGSPNLVSPTTVHLLWLFAHSSPSLMRKDRKGKTCPAGLGGPFFRGVIWAILGQVSNKGWLGEQTLGKTALGKWTIRPNNIGQTIVGKISIIRKIIWQIDML